MAIQSNVYTISDTRTYNSTKPIPAKNYMRVFVRVTDGDWTLVPEANYKLINNAAVINEDFIVSQYDQIEIRVADSPDELTTSPSDTAIVAGISQEVQDVAFIANEVVDVSGIKDEVVEVSSDPLKTAILNAGDNATTASDSVLDADSWANENEDVPVQEHTSGVGSDRVPTVYSAKHYATKSEAYANSSEGFKDASETASTNSQLKAWESEAERLTADSYATEPEDTFVKIYTSNGDGTFTATPTTEYSSLHYSAKAEQEVATVNPNDIVHTDGSGLPNEISNLVDLSSTINITTEEQEKKGNFTVGQLLSISSWSFVGATITLVLSSAHGFESGNIGETVYVKGLTGTTNLPNGTYAIASIVDTTTITFVAPSIPSGTPTVDTAELTHGLFIEKANRKVIDVGTIVTDGLYTEPNPFGNDKYLDCDAELYIKSPTSGKWATIKVQDTAYGASAHPTTDGIMVAVANAAILNVSSSFQRSGYPYISEYGDTTPTSAEALVVVTYRGDASYV